MLRWIKRQEQKNASLIGLDIGASSIKLLELNGDQLVRYAILPLPMGAVAASVLSSAVAQWGLKNKRAVIAVPDAVVISKIIQLDAGLNDNEIEAEILLMVDQHIPYAIAEVNLDFQLLNHNMQNPALVDVLLVAAHKRNVEARVAIVAASGLEVLAVDVASYAMQRISHLLFPAGVAPGNVIAIVDMGHATMTFTALDSEKVIFTWHTAFENQPASAEVIVALLRRVLQFFFAIGNAQQIYCLFLAGGMALLPGIARQITEQLGIKALLANPFAELNINSAINKTEFFRVAPCLLLSGGLAWQGASHVAATN